MLYYRYTSHSLEKITKSDYYLTLSNWVKKSNKLLDTVVTLFRSFYENLLYFVNKYDYENFLRLFVNKYGRQYGVLAWSMRGCYWTEMLGSWKWCKHFVISIWLLKMWTYRFFATIFIYSDLFFHWKIPHGMSTNANGSFMFARKWLSR